MIAADTSSLIAFLAGGSGPDVEQVVAALADDKLRLPPPVAAELLSKPNTQDAMVLIGGLTQLDITDGYWERAGASRALLISKGLKARLADALIAQCCIDADVPLIARDGDYRHFARWCGLKLAA